MASFRASDTFFRIRRYLRNLGETDMNLFAVQCENETYTISEWDYPEHPRPDASHLSEITTHQIQEERKSMIREHHTIDIYTYRVNEGSSAYTTIRGNACSFLSGREIRLTKEGYYRITVSGTSQGRNFQLNLSHAGISNATVVYSTNITTENNYFSIVSIIKTTSTQDKIYMGVVIHRGVTDNYFLEGTILAEYIK